MLVENAEMFRCTPNAPCVPSLICGRRTCFFTASRKEAEPDVPAFGVLDAEPFLSTPGGSPPGHERPSTGLLAGGGCGGGCCCSGAAPGSRPSSSGMIGGRRNAIFAGQRCSHCRGRASHAFVAAAEAELVHGRR